MVRQGVSQRLTFFDGVIIFLVLGISAALFFGIVSRGAGEVAVIEIEGEIYGKYRFSDYETPEIIEITTEYGYNIVEISSRGIRVTDADCKDKIDVKRGIISRPGESIVCLPHKLIIYIEGEGEYDTISY